ncbi:hypothetical protein MFFC18_14400 [Mariniblastus fucicola]|uniref:Uncharacterized protein n=2 Tax=Mariniblastus fucicola TaxID=980251 RepID=A0A5B9P9G5_9BACT|nr:hypothetical protein MFFC18_14400 [Mariniblastus fucicola]
MEGPVSLFCPALFALGFMAAFNMLVNKHLAFILVTVSCAMHSCTTGNVCGQDRSASRAPEFEAERLPTPSLELAPWEEEDSELEIVSGESAGLSTRTKDAEPSPVDTPPEGQVWETESHNVRGASQHNPILELEGEEVANPYRGDWFDLLKMEHVCREIELIREQEVAIRDVSRKYRSLCRSVLREYAQAIVLPTEEAYSRQAMQMRLAKLRTNAIDEIRSDILLPQQARRLRKIDFQMTLQSQGIVATLRDRDLGLDITKEQLRVIESRAAKLSVEYDLLLRGFRIEFRNQILGQLNSDQRAEIESLMQLDASVGAEVEADQDVTMREELERAALENLQEYRSGQ